jgi:hypothetical protein
MYELPLLAGFTYEPFVHPEPPVLEAFWAEEERPERYSIWERVDYDEKYDAWPENPEFPKV